MDKIVCCCRDDLVGLRCTDNEENDDTDDSMIITNKGRNRRRREQAIFLGTVQKRLILAEVSLLRYLFSKMGMTTMGVVSPRMVGGQEEGGW
jgi:hypothetical protein